MGTILDIIGKIIEYGSNILTFLIQFLGYGVSIIASEPLLGVLFILLCCKLF